MEHHEYLMKALRLAQERRGFCAPNPAVGAILVKGNEIIAEGYHFAAGYPHAEVVVCEHLPPHLKDVALYVTLEPCCYWGKTPPCTELILERGIKKVFYGYQDPNPKVASQGEQFLRSHGVDCQKITLPEIDAFYKSYTHWTLTGKPVVTSKLAISLDSKIADASAKPVAITGNQVQHYTHLGRLKSDAILTSSRTILQDDPALNVRINDEETPKRLYILDSSLSLPLTAKVFSTASSITVFHSGQNEHKIELLKDHGVVCHEIKANQGLLDLKEVLHKIGTDGVHDLWVEAGGKVFTAFLREQLVHKSIIYVAPKLLGSAAYSAFSEENNLLSGAKSINWHFQGSDAVCEIEW